MLSNREKYKIVDTFIKFVSTFLVGIGVCFVIAMFAGCTKTIYQDVPVEVERIKYEKQNFYYSKVDSIHDSVSVYVKGDTVFKYKYKYAERLVHDSIYINKVDSIDVPVYINKTEIVHSNKYKIICYILTALLLILIVYAFWKRMRVFLHG